MELLWLLFVTFLAVGSAYFIGGIIDRRAIARNEAVEAAQRERELVQCAKEMLTLSDQLISRGLLLPEHRTAAAREAANTLCKKELTHKEMTMVEQWIQSTMS